MLRCVNMVTYMEAGIVSNLYSIRPELMAAGSTKF